MKAAQALVTGATGFIGRHVVRQLLHEGRSVRVLTRRAGKARELFGERGQVIEGNILNGKAIAQAVKEVEQIYHIAGVYRFGIGHRRELEFVNCEGTRLLLEAAWKTRVASVVHVSSA